MINFRKSAAVRDYLSRREQRRLMGWVLLVGLPVVAVSLWLERRDAEWAERPAPQAIDTRLASAANSTSLDSFTAMADRPSLPDRRAEYLPGVNPELLRTIRDDTPSRSGEYGAFQNLLEALADTPEEQLRERSLGDVAYAQLFRQPDVYRGKVVGVSGTVRRGYKLPMAKNELGLDHYYQLWIQPRGAPDYLVVVYALNLPEGFSLGESLEEPVALTGLFFKRWAYQAKGGTMAAPLVLANTFDRRPPAPTAAPHDDRLHFGWVLAAATLCVAGLIATWRLAQRFAARPASTRAVADPAALDALRTEPMTEVNEELKRLEREG